jgi:hypothetical protein
VSFKCSGTCPLYISLWPCAPSIILSFTRSINFVALCSICEYVYLSLCVKIGLFLTSDLRPFLLGAYPHGDPVGVRGSIGDRVRFSPIGLSRPGSGIEGQGGDGERPPDPAPLPSLQLTIVHISDHSISSGYSLLSLSLSLCVCVCVCVGPTWIVCGSNIGPNLVTLGVLSINFPRGAPIGTRNTSGPCKIHSPI